MGDDAHHGYREIAYTTVTFEMNILQILLISWLHHIQCQIRARAPEKYISLMSLAINLDSSQNFDVRIFENCLVTGIRLRVIRVVNSALVPHIN